MFVSLVGGAGGLEAGQVSVCVRPRTQASCGDVPPTFVVARSRLRQGKHACGRVRGEFVVRLHGQGDDGYEVHYARPGATHSADEPSRRSAGSATSVGSPGTDSDGRIKSQSLEAAFQLAITMRERVATVAREFSTEVEFLIDLTLYSASEIQQRAKLVLPGVRSTPKNRDSVSDLAAGGTGGGRPAEVPNPLQQSGLILARMAESVSETLQHLAPVPRDNHPLKRLKGFRWQPSVSSESRSLPMQYEKENRTAKLQYKDGLRKRLQPDTPRSPNVQTVAKIVQRGRRDIEVYAIGPVKSIAALLPRAMASEKRTAPSRTSHKEIPRHPKSAETAANVGVDTQWVLPATWGAGAVLGGTVFLSALGAVVLTKAAVGVVTASGLLLTASSTHKAVRNLKMLAPSRPQSESLGSFERWLEEKRKMRIERQHTRNNAISTISADRWDAQYSAIDSSISALVGVSHFVPSSVAAVSYDLRELTDAVAHDDEEVIDTIGFVAETAPSALYDREWKKRIVILVDGVLFNMEKTWMRAFKRLCIELQMWDGKGWRRLSRFQEAL
ncbi:hypothetical protein FVE85_0434 [Porphyridium purpureum]|uniref:Uncharacterized protein n=1 Tax=Porphyridium purpureum TaxID=35688 RepID=A0A5J4YZW9_PORPP|nr:hypothetical protein FVE85_0434 [Porphyridium purpureum]|eukprot:POR2944..scf208_2